MKAVLVLTIVVGAALLAQVSSPSRSATRATSAAPVPTSPNQPSPTALSPGEHVDVPPPPLSEGVFPCSFCHADLKPNRTRRVVEDHDDIVLKHDEKNRWCLDCHDADNRDFLHLASGERVSFEESYRVCGQCHGEKYRDWRAGVHGRRTGAWNGRKGYLLCVNCHSPHQPKFKSIAPQPPPKPPSRPGL